MPNSCGGCTQCCRLVPVKELELPAFTRCQHERSAPFATPGCAIYADRPPSCRLWSCQWLTEGWNADMRPDRCGVVVDPVPDLVRINGTEHAAFQFWAAPGHEMAFEKQPVLALVLAATAEGAVVLWRQAGSDGQLSRALLRGPDGELIASPLQPPDIGYSQEIPLRERLRRLAELSR
jgi:hypothetical protein